MDRVPYTDFNPNLQNPNAILSNLTCDTKQDISFGKLMNQVTSLAPLCTNLLILGGLNGLLHHSFGV